MDGSVKTNFSQYKDMVDLMVSLAKLSVSGVGSICWVKYINEIGHFPEGVNLGDGVAMYLVTSGFLFVYGVFLLSTTALGSVLMGFIFPLMERIVFFVKNKWKNSCKENGDSMAGHNFKEMREGYLFVPALIGAFLILAISKGETSRVLLLTMCAATQGMLYGAYLRQWVKNIPNGNLGQEKEGQAIEQNINRQRMKIDVGLMVMVFTIPLIFATKFSDISFVDAAFNFSGLRKENAIVHIKSPWSSKMAGGGNTPLPSFLGANYQEYKGVRVLLQSIGAKVIVEIPGDGDNQKGRALAIPKEEIFVE